MVSKKNLVLLVVLVVFASMHIFGGCGKKNDDLKEQVSSGEFYHENGLPKDKKVKLTAIFPVQGHGKEYMEYAIETFEDKFPNVEIDVRYIKGGVAYAQVLQSILKAGIDQEMYDWAFSYGEYQPLLINEGKLEPQDELWERNLYDRPDVKVKDIVIADELEIFGSDGHLYVLPQMLSIYGLYFNKKMFESYGWNQESENWDEFIRLCENINKANSDVYPVVATGKFPLYFKYAWGAVPYEIGGERFRKAEYNLEPNVYLDNAYLMMFKRLEEFARKGYIHPGTVSFDHTQSQMEFLQGKAAMIPVGSWVANEMREVMPSSFEWGFMPFPGNEVGQQKVILTKANGNGYIWRNRPKLNKQWAKEFNLWMLNLSIQQKIGEGGAVPVRKDFTGHPEILKGLSPSVRVAMERINETNAKTLNPDVRSRLVANPEMAKMNKVIGDNIVAVILQKKRAEDAVKEINDLYMRGLSADKKNQR